MTTEVAGSSKDRLLAATAALTYREGVGVGIEALCKAAGVSKRSLYQLFESKGDLLAASLERSAAAYMAEFLPGPQDDLSPRGRILYVFDRLESQARTAEYRGCQYLAAQIELKDPSHPASRVAAQVKRKLTRFFRAAGAQGGAADPDALARQLILLFDGASARAGTRADNLKGLIKPMVTTTLDAAGVR